MGRKTKIAAAVFIVALAAALVYVNEEMGLSWSGWGSNNEPPNNSTSTGNTTNPRGDPRRTHKLNRAGARART
ncbi:MAG: hypothetical protein ACFFCW_44480 [Candidatus Hodarchaeota archaeon]